MCEKYIMMQLSTNKIAIKVCSIDGCDDCDDGRIKVSCIDGCDDGVVIKVGCGDGFDEVCYDHSWWQ